MHGHSRAAQWPHAPEPPTSAPADARRVRSQSAAVTVTPARSGGAHQQTARRIPKRHLLRFDLDVDVLVLRLTFQACALVSLVHDLKTHRPVLQGNITYTMRPPTRTTRSVRRLSDAHDSDEPPSPARRTANSKIAPKLVGRSISSKSGAPYAEKKPRHRMTDLQLERLEALYQQDTHPTRDQKQALGEEVGMCVILAVPTPAIFVSR